MHINAIRRESENIQRLYEIEASGVSGLPNNFFGERRLLREDTVLLVHHNNKKTSSIICLMFQDCVLFLGRNKLRIAHNNEFYAKFSPIFFSVTLLLNDVPDDVEKGFSNVVEFSFVKEEERLTIFVCCATKEVKVSEFFSFFFLFFFSF
jgi:hypothetical protein